MAVPALGVQLRKELSCKTGSDGHYGGERQTTGIAMGIPSQEVFADFASHAEPRLRYALVAELGYDRGREAAQDALVWAWEHWDRLERVTNRCGYLYRVAKRRALRQRLPIPVVVDRLQLDPPMIEPGLHDALGCLSSRQRVSVFLVEGLGMTHQETANFLGVSRSTVQTHLERALERLRRELGVVDAV